jgi:hypothetical protein
LWGVGWGCCCRKFFQKNPENILKKISGSFPEGFKKSGIIFESHAENFSDAAIIMFSYLFP